MPMHRRQESFAAFMEQVLEDRERLALLLLILPLPSRERRARLDEQLLRRDWRMDAAEIFDFLADDLFAAEVFSYLRSSRGSAVPDINRALLPPPCSTKVIIDGKVVECLEERPHCAQNFVFGATRFCLHPLRVPEHQRLKGNRTDPFD